MKRIVFKAFNFQKNLYIDEDIVKDITDLKRILNEKNHIFIKAISIKKIKKFSKKNIKNFYLNMGTLLKSGISLKKSIEFQRDIVKKEDEKLYYKVILKSLESGEGLLDILEKYKISNRKERFILYTLESSGDLGEGFLKLFTLREKNEKIKKEFITLLSYPIFILFISTIIIFFIMIFIIPNFISLYEGNEKSLPLITRIIFGVYKNFRYLILGVITFIIFLYIYLKKRKKTFYFYKKIKLQREIIIFLESLGILLESGLAIDKGIDILIGEVDKEIKREFYRLKIIEKGESFSKAIERLKVLSNLELGMIRVGEETGTLPKILKEISKRRKERIEKNIKIVLKLIEPVILLLIGVLICFFVIGLYMPILNIGDMIEK